MPIPQNLQIIRKTIPQNIEMVVVTKTMPVEKLQIAYASGERSFGENRVQELVQKQALLPTDIRWHLIGHLQSNKVKFIAPFVHLIHSVDSLKLLQEIDHQAKKCNRVISCLLQFHIAEEETKFGLNEEEASAMMEALSKIHLPNICLSGVMGMATFTDDSELVHREFRHLKHIFDWLKSDYFADNPSFKEISMGMSGDYEIGIQEGATIVRIGTLIFGERLKN